MGDGGHGAKRWGCSRPAGEAVGVDVNRLHVAAQDGENLKMKVMVAWRIERSSRGHLGSVCVGMEVAARDCRRDCAGDLQRGGGEHDGGV